MNDDAKILLDADGRVQLRADVYGKASIPLGLTNDPCCCGDGGPVGGGAVVNCPWCCYSEFSTATISWSADGFPDNGYDYWWDESRNNVPPLQVINPGDGRFHIGGIVRRFVAQGVTDLKLVNGHLTGEGDCCFVTCVMPQENSGELAFNQLSFDPENWPGKYEYIEGWEVVNPETGLVEGSHGFLDDENGTLLPYSFLAEPDEIINDPNPPFYNIHPKFKYSMGVVACYGPTEYELAPWVWRMRVVAWRWEYKGAAEGYSPGRWFSYREEMAANKWEGGTVSGIDAVGGDIDEYINSPCLPDFGCCCQYWEGSWAVFQENGDVTYHRGQAGNIQVKSYAGNVEAIPEWDSGHEYAAGDLAKTNTHDSGIEARTWRSLQDGNTGHEPPPLGTVSQWWELVGIGRCLESSFIVSGSTVGVDTCPTNHYAEIGV